MEFFKATKLFGKRSCELFKVFPIEVSAHIEGFIIRDLAIGIP